MVPFADLKRDAVIVDVGPLKVPVASNAPSRGSGNYLRHRMNVIHPVVVACWKRPCPLPPSRQRRLLRYEGLPPIPPNCCQRQKVGADGD
jgi:hypothetical protein